MNEQLPNARIKIFVGQMQSKLPTALVQQAQALGSRLQWVLEARRKPSSVHIACHLGEGICKYPKAEFVILSNDKGFDPLVRHLVARGFKCRREARRDACAPRAAPGARAGGGGPAQALREEQAAEEAATQHNYLATHFNKKLTGEEVKKAVEHLLEAGLIAGTEAAVTYNF